METFWRAGDALGPAKVMHIQVASLGLKAVLVSVMQAMRSRRYGIF